MSAMEKLKAEHDGVLEEIASRIISAFAPRRILLYGSRATGKARPDSDYDLLIVWRDENPPASRTATVRRALLGMAKSLDIEVVTPSEYERFRTRRVHIVAIAEREGKLLYAA
jgi:predicted nucleotidyltransferase